MGAGIIGAVAAIACTAAVLLLPTIVGFFIEAASSSLGLLRRDAHAATTLPFRPIAIDLEA